MFRSSFKTYLFLCLLCALTFTSFSTFADEAFVIDSYGVDISVDSRRVHHVTETIDLTFSQPRHGIIRSIPLESSEESYLIENIAVNAPFSVERDGGLSLKIGSEESTVYGEVTYVISYDMIFAADEYDSFDLSYISPIGTQWDTSIDSADITVRLPGDITGLKVTKGSYGSTDEITDYRVEGGTVSLSYGPLYNYQGITLWIEAAEGTFSDAPSSLRPWVKTAGILLLLLSAAILAFIIVQWYKYGRDDKIIPIVEFYPPEGMNPAEMEYVMKNAVSNCSAASLIFFWASKGFIGYKETEKGFTLTKLRPIEGRPLYEATAFEELFALGDGNTVNDRQIEKGFYKSVDNIRGGVEGAFFGKRELWDISASARSGRMLLVSLAPLLILGIVGFIADRFFTDFIPMLAPLIVFFGFRGAVQNENKFAAKKAIFAVAIIVLAAAACSVITAFLSAAVFMGYGVVCLVLLLSCLSGSMAALIQKRTDYATSIIGRSMGFADFLRTAEKNRIESLMEENPAYYFDILPYAVVLGVTKTWAKKFDTMIFEPPQWYSGNDVFTAMAVSNSLNRSINRVENGISTRQARQNASSSTIHGGGGFSGGGAGGGGGSSW